MNTQFQELPLIGWLVVALLLISQSTWLFVDARKKGHNAWLWGILGLIQCPIPFIVYYAFVRKK